MKAKIHLLFVLMLILLTGHASAQVIEHPRLISFEDKSELKMFSTKKSKLTLSDEHFKDGSQSLKWSFKPNAELTLSKDLEFEPKDPTGKDTYLSSFVIWVYNDTPIDGDVLFKFLKDDKLCSSFPMKLNFKGWRSAYVSYERDMDGAPQEGMNRLQIVAPNAKGTLYFDMLLTAALVDHRHHTRDIHLPFVNMASTNHWLALYSTSQIEADLALEYSVTKKQQEEIYKIEDRLKGLLYSPSKLTGKQFQKLKGEYQTYEIIRTPQGIKGKPLFYVRASEAFERLFPGTWNSNVYVDEGMEYREYFNLMYDIAVAYLNAKDATEKFELRTMFMNMYDHAADQGVAYGSAMGIFTHFGYSFRKYFTAYFLMKDVLAEEGKLEEASKAMLWYSMANEVFVKPTEPGMDIDTFNTLAVGRISSILAMPEGPEKLRYLQAYSRWINNGCLPAKGLDDSFKSDGSVYHHKNHYPAYGVGGLTGATDVIYLFNNTDFAVSELGHNAVKNSLLAMRFYCNQLTYPLAMSGRHPNGKGQLDPSQFARLALAGSPDGKESIDVDLASAYLRLVDEAHSYGISLDKKPNHKVFIQAFTDAGLIKENTPNGTIVMPYATSLIHRLGDWSAIIRGHSRYLWAAEHYRGANLYGRYLAHGGLELDLGEPKTWIEEGFDWARVPGTTAIRLPIDSLQAVVLNVDKFSGFEEMLYSDEAFAGGLTDGKNGVFAMKLHEHDKYNGSLRARKSYHLFGNRIIAIGTDIENLNGDYNTETTVFQLPVLDTKDKAYWSSYKKQDKLWVDHLGTGYFIPNVDAQLTFENNENQLSRFQNSGKENEGHWVNLVFDHGKALQSGSYEYLIVPHYADSGIDIAKPIYNVLQKDSKAHIVEDIASKTTSYAIFEELSDSKEGLVAAVDTASLVMVSDLGETYNLTVANPDLALYRGASDDIYDEQGKRIERSIYSRPWIGNASMEVPVKVTLRGIWNISDLDNDLIEIIENDADYTTILFKCIEGKSVTISINR